MVRWQERAKERFEEATRHFAGWSTYGCALGATLDPVKHTKILQEGHFAGSGLIYPSNRIVRRDYLAMSPIQPLKPLPLEEAGGKVRVATLHPAEEVQVARQLTSLWLRGLKRCMTTRDMLTGQKVVVHRQNRQSLAYSADLSAATDYIPHELAKFVGQTLCEVLDRPQDIPFVNNIFGPKEVEGYGNTCNGVHMGLGPSWVVLSLLNGFAAWYTGARKETYAICGDDLIGNWPKKLMRRYEVILQRLGLVVNKSKSFSGKRGVFCEMLMVPDSNGTLISHDMGKLSALFLSRYCASASKHIYSTLENLEPGLIDTRESMRMTYLPSYAGPGKVKHGGCGVGGLEIGGLISLCRDKPQLDATEGLPLTVCKELQKYTTSGHVSPNSDGSQGSITVADFVIACRTGVRLGRAKVGVAPHETIPMCKKQYRKLCRRNHQRGNYKVLIQAIQSKHCKVSSKNKRLAIHICRKYKNRLSKLSCVRRRLECVLSRPRANRLLSAKLCQRLLSQVCAQLHTDQLMKSLQKTTTQPWTSLLDLQFVTSWE
jgi:hypothetical protein